MLNKTQKEELRHQARKFLACRPRAAFTAQQAFEMLMFRSQLDFTFEVADLEEAFGFLAGLTPAQARSFYDDLGSTLNWQITTEGVKAFERGA
ncbi:MAG: hypothetical protein NTY53_05040 [Kiritimatiellaeota bacterium]|nr:hypothetical protein [Kiritimatiellota bacterium]